MPQLTAPSPRRSARPARALAPLALLAVTSACSRPSGPTGACDRITGVWHGEAIVADGGQDEQAIALVQEVIRGEAWRITRVTPSGLQRERVGAAGGPPIGEAMYIRENAPNRCVPDLQSRGSTGTHSVPLTLTVRSDGRLESVTGGNWYTAVYRRP